MTSKQQQVIQKLMMIYILSSQISKKIFQNIHLFSDTACDEMLKNLEIVYQKQNILLQEISKNNPELFQKIIDIQVNGISNFLKQAQNKDDEEVMQLLEQELINIT